MIKFQKGCPTLGLIYLSDGCYFPLEVIRKMTQKKRLGYQHRDMGTPKPKPFKSSHPKPKKPKKPKK